MTTNTIHHEQVAALQGATEPVHTRWAYRDDEPFAVTVAFCTERGQWIEWVFARDLLDRRHGCARRASATCRSGPTTRTTNC